MKSPNPSPKGKPRLNAADLTTRGQPRKRAAGAGRPALADPRCKTLPRITVAAHKHLQTIATRQRLSLADALEIAIMTLHKRSKPAALTDAADLLNDIMQDTCNAQDEAEKWLRAYAPQYLAKTTGH